MRRIIIMVIIFLLSFILVTGCSAYAQEMRGNIKRIVIDVTITPIKDSPYCYSYSTDDEDYIKIIEHTLKSFKYEDDGKTINGGDIPIVNIRIITENDMVYRCGFVFERFYDNDGKQYQVSRQDYVRILNLFYAMKTDEFMLNNEITFTPSEWAESYVTDAIEQGFVPKLNQINYTGDITRLEVCQLAASFLKANGYEEKEGDNPFADTSDPDVILLYNAGIIDGKTDTEFCPYDFITREELAKVLSNMYALAGGEKAEQTYEVAYADSNEISGWATEYVNKMSALEILKGDEKGKFNPKSNTTKEQVIITLLRMADAK